MNVHVPTEGNVIIKPIRKLTEKMLALEVAENRTLKEFLATQCALFADGQTKFYTTTEYACFKLLEENRFINEAHVQTLIDSYVKDGYLFTIIFVNEQLQIIDGQHRFEAAKQAMLPVHFVIMPGWGIKAVTILNVNSRNWTILDFMNTHAKAGNPNYIRFREFYEAHDFEVTICQLIIIGKRNRGNASIEKFRNGYMQVDDQQITVAYLRAKKIIELKPFHPFGWKSRNFVETMLILFNTKGYDHSQLVEKLKSYPEMILNYARTLRIEEYLKLLVDKYNYRRSKDKLHVQRR